MNGNRKTNMNTAKRATAKQPPKRVSRKSVKRRLMIKRILGLVLGAVVIGGCFYACAKLLFVVKTVNVSGSKIFTAEEIINFMAIPQEESMFRVDEKALEESLGSEFTYLESADVIKRFPDIIEVKLTDSTESFYTVYDDGYKVYSQGFKYLRNSSEPPVGAVWLELDVDNTDLLEQCSNLLDMFSQNGLDKITKISLVQENMIAAQYDGRLDINFGTMLDMEYKIKMCKKIIEEKIPESEKGTIDATNSGEVVYTRQ